MVDNRPSFNLLWFYQMKRGFVYEMEHKGYDSCFVVCRSYGCWNFHQNTNAACGIYTADFFCNVFGFASRRQKSSCFADCIHNAGPHGGSCICQWSERPWIHFESFVRIFAWIHACGICYRKAWRKSQSSYKCQGLRNPFYWNVFDLFGGLALSLLDCEICARQGHRNCGSFGGGPDSVHNSGHYKACGCSGNFFAHYAADEKDGHFELLTEKLPFGSILFCEKQDL